ncbi:MAG: hypothetical protein ACXWXS_04585 [Actinomycetota bacterium]
MHGDVQILAAELANHRVHDLMREAEAERLARTTRRARLADRHGASRRFAQAATAAVVWPVRS